MGRLGSKLAEDERVKNRQGANCVAHMPGSNLNDNRANKRSHDPADDHPRHAKRNKERALFGRSELREKRRNDWRAHAEEQAGDNAKHCKHLIIRRKYARNSEKTVQKRTSSQDLLTTELVR